MSFSWLLLIVTRNNNLPARKNHSTFFVILMPFSVQIVGHRDNVKQVEPGNGKRVNLICWDRLFRTCQRNACAAAGASRFGFDGF
jgi:hypothetical protein